MSAHGLFLRCPLGTCRRCDDETRAEHDAACLARRAAARTTSPTANPSSWRLTPRVRARLVLACVAVAAGVALLGALR